jgi:hypothetical protein
MAASGLLREQDLRALTAVVEDGLRDDPGPAMPWAALDRLYQLISSDTVEFDEVDLHGHHSLAGQGILDDGSRYVEVPHHSDDDDRFWALLEEFLPYSYPRRAGDLASVVRWSDFYTESELRNSRFYAEYLTYHSVPKYCMVVPLPAGPHPAGDVLSFEP